MELEGQTAVVTGAGRGIGRAVALELAARGAAVALLARSERELEKVAAEIAAAGRGVAEPLVVDVRRPDQVDDAVRHVEATYGHVALLVNNAGAPGPAGRDWEVDPESWWECIESIVRGAFLCARAVLPGMVARAGGRIVEVASVTGTGPWPLITATSVAKTALIRHVEGLAASAGPAGVKVFAVHPGIVRTDLLLSYRSSEDMAALLDSLPPAAFSPPELAAGVVARIAAGELDALSGRFLDVTSDVDSLATRAAALSTDALTLRLVPGS